VEVAEGGAGDGYTMALEAVRFDVTADWDSHISFSCPPPPRGSGWLKDEWMQLDSEGSFAKYRHPGGLSVNIGNGAGYGGTSVARCRTKDND
jgi:hypothetical protein